MLSEPVDVLFSSPWPWAVVAVGLIVVGVVAASGWTPRRFR